MAAVWYYKLMGETHGPFTANQLREKAAAREITPDAWVRKGHDGKWITADRVSGLFADEPSPSPIPPIARPPQLQTPPPQINSGPSLPTTRRTRRRMPKGRKLILLAVGVVSAAGLFALFQGTRASINPLQSIANAKLQSAVDDVIEHDSRNAGIEVSAYYRDTFDKSVVVFDLQSISGSNSRLDVFRVFLDFAEVLEDEPCEWVVLAYKADGRFKIEGSYFRQLGHERDSQNPAYTIRTFPENLKTPSGTPAYSEWTGGLLGVLQQQMEDFNDFHNKWYLKDMVGEN